MTDLFDTKGIPDDPAHWDSLAARVASETVRGSGAEWLARSRGSWLVAAVLLIAALVSLLAPTAPRAPSPTEWSRTLAPSDNVGRMIVDADAPPSIDALLLPRRGS